MRKKSYWYYLLLLICATHLTLVGSSAHPISNYSNSDPPPRSLNITQNLEPVAGEMPVAEFTSSTPKDVQAATYNKRVKQGRKVRFARSLFRLIGLVTSAIVIMWLSKQLIERVNNLIILTQAARNPNHPANEGSCHSLYNRRTGKLEGARGGVLLPNYR